MALRACASAAGSRGIGAAGEGGKSVATIARTVAAIKTFGEVDERSLPQLRTCMAAGDDASLVVWLVSEGAAYATGASFVVDGGLLLMAAVHDT